MAEAVSLCATIENNAAALRTGQLGERFRLDGASFVLHARARNTIYRVSAQTDWFLKLTREGNAGPMEHERLGVDAVEQALSSHPRYGGAAITRVSLDPAYVLAAMIPGKALNRLVASESWIPGNRTRRRLQGSFSTLGSLLAALHKDAPASVNALPATTRPFEVVDGLLRRVQNPDETTDAIDRWQRLHRQSDEGTIFQHGNFRLDNILDSGDRLGFIDFENCGTGSPYQDLSRPVVELILTQALVLFPRSSPAACIKAFLDAYSASNPVDPSQLWKVVTVRMARYYLESRARRFRVTIGGIPVSKRKLGRLVEGFLTADPDLLRVSQLPLLPLDN